MDGLSVLLSLQVSFEVGNVLALVDGFVQFLGAVETLEFQGMIMIHELKLVLWKFLLKYRDLWSKPWMSR